MTIKKRPNSKEKGAPKGDKPLNRAFKFSAKTYFLTYKGISDSGERLTKEGLANYLVRENPTDVKLFPSRYLVCEEMYDSGLPHFHAILVYDKRKQVENQDHFDYLGVHPNIQTMRNMRAALDYVYKEDPSPCTNMDVAQEKRVARAKDSSSLYEFLEEQMVKDPFNFDAIRYCVQHDLTKQIYKANYTKAVNLVTKAQAAHCNRLLFQRPGFKPIDRALIEQNLTHQELRTFDSWPGYQRIIDYLNEVNVHGYDRPFKSKQLLMVGRPNTGKTTLVREIERYSAVYHLDVSNWFPNYRDGVYKVLFWDEFRLKGGMTHTDLLKFLQGSPMDLEYKGGSALRMNNQLIIMTSNMTLEEHIDLKFKDIQQKKLATQNLQVRLEEIRVPPSLDLFLLLRLIHENS